MKSGSGGSSVSVSESDREATRRVDSEQDGNADAPSSLSDRYVVLERLGSGGLGVVYAGWDLELERRVAIKLLKPRQDGSARALAMAVREAQALARLAHPHVVSIFDVGTYGTRSTADAGVFLVMEVLEGPTLAQWLVQHHPNVDAILDRFIQAGRGLAAAHTAGMVHRDFKPTNAMVTAGGIVKVVDFGLAIAESPSWSDSAHATGLESSDPGWEDPVSDSLQPERLTRTGVVIGTPRYMAPEQHRGRPLGPATDQYAWCVALWRALRRGEVFDESALLAMTVAKETRKIQSAPSDDRTPRWLRPILLRGLDPEPTARWPSMDALLQAVERGRSPRKSRWYIAAASAGALMLAATLRGDDPDSCPQPGPLWPADARPLALERVERAQEGSFEKVAAAVSEYEQRWAETAQRSCQASTDGTLAAEAFDRRMQCLRERRAEAQSLLLRMGRSRELAANALSRVESLRKLEHCEDDESLALDMPPPQSLEAAQAVARLRETMGRIDDLAQDGHGKDALRLLETSTSEANALGYAPVQVEFAIQRAHMMQQESRFDEALAAYQAAYAQASRIGYARLAGEAATGSMFVLGIRQSRPHEALAFVPDAEAWLERAGYPARAHGRLLNAHGTILMNLDRLDEALDKFDRASQVQATNPKISAVERTISINNAASALQELGRLEEAMERQREVLTIRERELGPDHPYVATIRLNLGNALLDSGRYEDAQAHLERALAIFEQQHGADNPVLVSPLLSVGISHKKRGDYARARPYYERALEIAVATHGEDHKMVVLALGNLGNLAKREGKLDEALEHLQLALARAERVWGSQHSRVSTAHLNLGHVYKQKGLYDDAARHYGQAHAIAVETVGAQHSDAAQIVVSQGNLAMAQDDYETAGRRFGQGLETIEDELGPDHPQTVYARLGLGSVALHDERFADAAEHYGSVIAIGQASDLGRGTLGEARWGRAQAWWGQRKRAESRAEASAAVEDFRIDGPGSADELAEVQAWMQRHAE